MKTPAIIRPKALPPRQPGEKAEYKPRTYAKLRKISIEDVPLVVLTAKSNKAHDLFPMSNVLNTVEFLQDIFEYLSYQDLNSAYHACKGFQLVIRDSQKLRQTLFLAPDLDVAGGVKFLPTKFFNPRDPLLRPHGVDRTVLRLTTHEYERLRQPPRLEFLNRFITQPPLRYIEVGIRAYVPATDEQCQKKMCVSRDDGIRLADFMDGIKQWLTEVFSLRPPYWTMSGYFWDGVGIRPLEIDEATAS